MSGKSTIHRAIPALALSIAMIALFGPVRAHAVPIRPDIRKLLEHPQDAGPQFAPARAGWHGPESAKTGDESPNPVMEKFSPAGSARAVREALVAAAVPDWRILAVILALIIILRKLRTRPKNARSSEQDDQTQLPSAA